MPQPSLAHNIFHPQVLSGNQCRVISDRLTVLYENEKLPEDLYIILATAAATQIIPGPLNSGHRKGLERQAASYCQLINHSQLDEQLRVYAKLVMLSILYLRGDEKNGKTLVSMVDENSPEDAPVLDASFLQEIRRQGELFNTELHDTLGFERVNAGDVRYFSSITEKPDLIKAFHARAKFGCAIFFELVHGHGAAFVNSYASKNAAKRLDDMHKNFKFAATTLEHLINRPYLRRHDQQTISVPYGTPNYG